MHTDFLISMANNNIDKEAFIVNNNITLYREFLTQYDDKVKYLKEHDIKQGEVVAVESDFSSQSTALLLALIDNNNIIVPLTSALGAKKEEFCKIAKVQSYIKLTDDGNIIVKHIESDGQHELYKVLRDKSHPGIVFFSSGSTGASKGAVHDLIPILNKFKMPRKMKRMITFLMFDHMGGLNTLLHNLSGGGCVITVRNRTPEAVLEIVEKYHVQVLPVSPTFINMMLLSEAYKKYNLSSLETISYGTEVMPETTLKKLNIEFPNVRLVQTYGLSELGVMDTKSKSNDSLWVKLGGVGFETRVRENMLEIKANSAMLGYLNAPSPYTEDGWFMTMDMVEQDGEYYRILGRKSEIINVGGEKVYPAEVESFFLEMPGVEDVAVRGEQNPLMGNIVFAKFKISTDESKKDFQKRMREFAKGKLVGYKIPQQIELVSEEDIHSVRLKKDRK